MAADYNLIGLGQMGCIANFFGQPAFTIWCAFGVTRLGIEVSGKRIGGEIQR